MAKKLVPMGWVYQKFGEEPIIMGDTKGIIKTREDGKAEILIMGGLKKGHHVHIFPKEDGNMGQVITNEEKRDTNEEHIHLSKEELDKVRE